MNRIVKIPVKVSITGSPLTILPNANGVTIEDSTPTIRFIFVPSLATPLRKTLRIVNESCADIALSWRVFKRQRESLFEVWDFCLCNLFRIIRMCL